MSNPEHNWWQTKTPLLRRTDLWLWRLPRPARKLIVAPIALVCAAEGLLTGGAGEMRYAWKRVLEAAHNPPSR